MRTILLALFCCFSVFPLVLCCLITHVHEELHDIIVRIRKKHRYPMKLVHVIRRIDSVIRTERAEHFCRELEIDYIDDLVAVKTELSTGYAHNDSIPLLVIRMAEHSRDKIFFEGIVRRGAVGGEAVGKKLLLCHFHNSLRYSQCTYCTCLKNIVCFSIFKYFIAKIFDEDRSFFFRVDNKISRCIQVNL